MVAARRTRENTHHARGGLVDALVIGQSRGPGRLAPARGNDAKSCGEEDSDFCLWCVLPRPRSDGAIRPLVPLSAAVRGL